MKKLRHLASFSLVLLFIACEEKKEDLSEKVNTDGAIETALSVEHIDNERDVLVTTHKIWRNNNLANEIVKYDTIPSLGKFSTTDDNGTTVNGQKDYEFYITVK